MESFDDANTFSFCVFHRWRESAKAKWPAWELSYVKLLNVNIPFLSPTYGRTILSKWPYQRKRQMEFCLTWEWKKAFPRPQLNRWQPSEKIGFVKTGVWRSVIAKLRDTPTQQAPILLQQVPSYIRHVTCMVSHATVFTDLGRFIFTNGFARVKLRLRV